ncbi:hypothetical protein Zm00014a_005323 [Zea mays]|uniref:Uncharacterized protein n=1 Tax=Zea mays TaxID=4577 RepID=A0A3L6FLY0_MAIZE|nr:hypothetical protein Zm00014a_005323 [Zea mays]
MDRYLRVERPRNESIIQENEAACIASDLKIKRNKVVMEGFMTAIIQFLEALESFYVVEIDGLRDMAFHSAQLDLSPEHKRKRINLYSGSKYSIKHASFNFPQARMA